MNGPITSLPRRIGSSHWNPSSKTFRQVGAGLGRSVQDDAHRPALVVFEHEQDGAGEVGASRPGSR
ncbi:MAG: hypothetical protein WKF75_02145 [Singulisphaera sp.]